MDAMEYLNKKIDEQRQMLIGALAQGSAKDFAEYQNMCGKIQGLNTALRELNELSETVRNHEDAK